MTHSTKVAIFDADSTIFDTSHRQHLSPRADPDATWESYALHCHADDVFPGVVSLIRLLHEAGVTIVVVSARPKVALEATQSALAKHNVPVDIIRLLNPDDPDEWHEDHTEFKRQVARIIKDAPNSQVVLAVEDWPHLAAMYHDEGIPSICVNPFPDESSAEKYYAV